MGRTVQHRVDLELTGGPATIAVGVRDDLDPVLAIATLALVVGKDGDGSGCEPDPTSSSVTATATSTISNTGVRIVRRKLTRRGRRNSTRISGGLWRSWAGARISNVVAVEFVLFS